MEIKGFSKSSLVSQYPLLDLGLLDLIRDNRGKINDALSISLLVHLLACLLSPSACYCLQSPAFCPPAFCPGFRVVLRWRNWLELLHFTWNQKPLLISHLVTNTSLYHRFIFLIFTFYWGKDSSVADLDHLEAETETGILVFKFYNLYVCNTILRYIHLQSEMATMIN
jgi:hypothetical protein